MFPSPPMVEVVSGFFCVCGPNPNSGRTAELRSGKFYPKRSKKVGNIWGSTGREIAKNAKKIASKDRQNYAQ